MVDVGTVVLSVGHGWRWNNGSGCRSWLMWEQ